MLNCATKFDGCGFDVHRQLSVPDIISTIMGGPTTSAMLGPLLKSEVGLDILDENTKHDTVKIIDCRRDKKQGEYYPAVVGIVLFFGRLHRADTSNETFLLYIERDAAGS